MLARLTFAAIAIFWIVMNVLLWRSEFGHGEGGASVPVATVWQKILTAPDNSSLSVLYKGRRLGFCRWAVNLGEELSTGQISTDDYAPEGRIERLTGYSIDFDGGVYIDAPTNRLTFDLSLKFGTNQIWRELRFRTSYQRYNWEIRSESGLESLRLRVDEAGNRWEEVIAFEELRNPQKFLTDFVGPAAPALAAGFGLPIRPAADGRKLSLQLPWEAHYDWVTMAHSRVRAYRLRARLLDRYRIVVYVSRVGEIMRVELPGDLVLSNDGIASLVPVP